MEKLSAKPNLCNRESLPPSPLSDEKWGVIAGILKLPPQLARVGDFILRDLSDEQIARHLELSVTTVRTYSERLRQRLGVSSRASFILRVFTEAERIDERHVVKLRRYPDDVEITT